LKKALETLWMARRWVDNQVRNHIDHNIFQSTTCAPKRIIVVTSITGADIRAFMVKSDAITGARPPSHVSIQCRDIWNMRPKQESPLSASYSVFNTWKELLGGTRRRDMNEKTAELWQKLDLNYIPTFHYLHKEALRFLGLHRGFEELTEDHLEQSRAKRAMIISRFENIATDPELIKKTALVKEE
jgi:hypothetical protein